MRLARAGFRTEAIGSRANGKRGGPDRQPRENLRFARVDPAGGMMPVLIIFDLNYLMSALASPRQSRLIGRRGSLFQPHRRQRGGVLGRQNLPLAEFPAVQMPDQTPEGADKYLFFMEIFGGTGFATLAAVKAAMRP